MTSVNQKIRYFLKSHKYQRIRILVLLLLSVVVVTAVITGLIKPAVSMTGDLTCTVAEHIHTDQCFADVLVCGLNESPAHYHDESCFEEKTVLVCGITDGSHIHTDECYGLREVVVCNLPEGEGHTHNEQCYEHKLVCNQQEHIHSEECYEQQPEQEYVLMSGFSSNFSAQTVSYLSGTEIDTAVSVNFGEYISRVSYKPVSSSSSEENTKPVKFTVNYLLPSNTLMQVNNNRQIYFKLPENVVISDAQSGPVKENGVQTGTYQITNDGYIIIDFDANYVQDGSTEITGDITFNAFVKKTDSASDTETVTMGNVSVDVDFSVVADTSPDLSVQKTNSGYDKVNNTIGYNVVISSSNGSGEGDITVTDYLDNADSSRIKLNLTAGQTISVTKTKSDSTTETVNAAVAVGSDGKVTITGLPALLAGEKYSFTYSALLTPGTQAEIINANNKISVSNGTLTASDEDYTSVATGCILTKSGRYNDKTDNIEWTIKILNPDGVNLNGYSVTDEMLSQTVPGTLKVLENGWKQIENAGTLDTSTNTFTFGSLTGTEYKLIYQTKSPDHEKTISNKAALKDSEGTSINEDTGNAYVGYDRNYIGKNSYSKGFDSSGNVRIGWSVSLQFQVGDFAGKTYTDTMTTDKTQHYMTVSQPDTIVLTGTKPDYSKVTLTKGTDYTVRYFGTDGAEITDLTGENVKICSYKITFADNETINSLSDIEITYESTGVLSDSMAVGETVNFNNGAEFDGVYTDSSYTETKKEALKKHDYNVWGQSETSHKTTELDKTETGDYVLKWTIIANESNNYSGDVTLTDTLPAGVTFMADSAVFMRHNGSYYETTSGMGTVFNAETNQIVFSIPASVHDGKAFRIDYSVSVTEEYIVQNSADNSASFTNTVSDGVNTATQTQKLSLPLITKTGSDPADVYDGDITYTIDVNPYALDLSASDTITVTDSLMHYSKKNENGTFMYTWGFSASLINLKVIDADTGRELSPTEYVLTCSDEEINTVNYSKFTLTLPDGKHFKIEYTYHLTVNTDEESEYKKPNGGKVENTATIDYGTGSEKFDYNKNYNLGRESSAHTATSDYIRIYKVDSGNFAVRLGGAVFNLYRWYDETWQPLVEQNRNEEGGIIPTWGTDTPMSLETDNANGSYLLPELTSGVLYKLVEVKAPENYVARTLPYYFVLNTLPSQLPEGVQISQVSTLLKGGIINVANEPITAVEMKVNKHWGEGTVSQPVDVQLLVSETPPDLPDMITVNISDIKGHSVTQKFVNKKTGDIVLTVETLNSYYNHLAYFKINGSDGSYPATISSGWNNSTDTDYATCYEFTVGSISGSAEIDIYFGDSQDYSKYKLQASNCTELSEGNTLTIEIPSGAVPVADKPTVTLSDENSWTYTWTGLPQCNANGTPYYYFVKELTQISGYTAEYDTNGINGGEVNLTNRKEAQKPTLPETGGKGVQRIVLTGALMMIVPVLCYYLINRRKKAV